MPNDSQNLALTHAGGLPSVWRSEHTLRICTQLHAELPLLDRPPVVSPSREVDLWDMWPIEQRSGEPATFDGNQLWIALSAPRLADPESRHNVARLRLLALRDNIWSDHGPLFPDGFSPGAREWSGSAYVEPGDNRVMVLFTATGTRGEQCPSYEQRLFQCGARISRSSGRYVLTDLATPMEIVQVDQSCYMRTSQTTGGAGTIKAFRDPGFFQDRRTGECYIYFAGSAARSTSPWNGVIGVAVGKSGPASEWLLLPPVISADGLNNELERPHMRCANGSYYLFWSTQHRVFAERSSAGPTGLYGMVGSSPLGPFKPLNGTGLVAANPASAPYQAYSWWVLSDLRVNSFVNYPGIIADPASETVESRRRHFGGVPAPFFRLCLDGARATIART